MWGLFGGATLALVVAQPAFAAQCATVSFSPASINIANWDPITPASKQASVTATITRANSSTTSVRLIFLDSNDRSQPTKLGTNAGASGPNYQVLTSSGVNILFPLNTAVNGSNAPLLSYASKSTSNAVSATYTVNVPANAAGTDFANGSYGETLSYAVQCFANGNKNNGSDGPTSGPVVALTIPNLVSLTTASAATLDFQNFTSLTQQLNIGLKSTGPVNVAINSDNNLKMVRLGASAPYPDNSQIKYFLSLRTAKIPNTPTTLTGQPRAGVGGTTWPLVLSLPNQPSGKVAGSYSDTITLTLTPGS
jgi:hypothetical protein